ncbi:GNAT family N-acetyltransferase [Herbaspirillum sp. meg3]|jgi:RimJ/RimL family protein N-acetyltransferase|uniref:GNAT family N-acetyltransferase n=1 Tax=Herbaspirillum sp. meg3 TaxID=2025949 RepID=UPI000B988A9A|nr:GNAT family N-acetyltransferase [Herbaspirillum sp. meg3]ASU38172.1 GNAT family N-acetyltransferase [Herbaspirillum sp. meg3]
MSTEPRHSRILLRPWRKSDLEPCAAMNADPEVMRYFPAVLNRSESDYLVQRIEEHISEHGFGLWVLEIPGELSFAGFVGLLRVPFDAHFSPAVEIGWRLVPQAWGKGYATEAAQAVLSHAFNVLGMKEIVSFTTAGNKRSQAVMRRIGMHTRVEENFEHPRLPAGHPLRVHVLYRLRREQWQLQSAYAAAGGLPGTAGLFNGNENENGRL